jgi:hypothetical protein
MASVSFDTKTKTFSKSTIKQVKNIFPTVARHKKYGSSMNGFINFYDSSDTLLGYWTNENKTKGVIRKN